ncbi:hypothetical protein [Halobellus sp. GM3]|uniref:hypothetical protein n=1 Tax=Halobellus sp. GM3 TaxID=3458410 RepID=UPI00403DEBBB
MRHSRRNRFLTLAMVVLIVGSAVGGFVATVGTVAAAGAVSYEDPSVTPSTLYAGSANGTITVNNTGGSAAEYAVSLSVDGTVVEWRNGTIASGEQRTVTILKTLWDTGDHTVTIAGGGQTVSQTVTVKTANAKYHGGADNRGYYPNQSGPANQPEELWNITDGTPLVMQPTVVGDTLYVAFHNVANSMRSTRRLAQRSGTPHRVAQMGRHGQRPPTPMACSILEPTTTNSTQ